MHIIFHDDLDGYLLQKYLKREIVDGISAEYPRRHRLQLRYFFIYLGIISSLYYIFSDHAIL